MKIAVFGDLRFATHGSPTGVGKHMVEMVRGLHGREDSRLLLFASRDQKAHPGRLGFLPVHSFPLRWKVAEGLWTACGMPSADRWLPEVDWVYCPKNDFVPTRRRKVAVTVHGAHELDPDYPQASTLGAKVNRIRRRLAYRRMLRQAALVLTVSEFLRTQMIEWFGLDPAKCCVVGNGVEEVFFRAAEEPPAEWGQGRGQPYVLGVGGLNYMDGGDRIVRLAETLAAKGSPIRLFVAGSQHEAPLLAAARRLPNLDLLGYVPAERLARLLRQAVAFFFPTRYETFGIAAAESMVVGTAVVTCRSTAVPEIVGDAALFVDPDDPGDCTRALCAVASDAELRGRLAELGRRRAATFTWGACVNRLVKALAEH